MFCTSTFTDYYKTDTVSKRENNMRIADVSGFYMRLELRTPANYPPRLMKRKKYMEKMCSEQ